jgi:hypothetical protein
MGSEDFYFTKTPPDWRYFSVWDSNCTVVHHAIGGTTSAENTNTR